MTGQAGQTGQMSHLSRVTRADKRDGRTSVYRHCPFVPMSRCRWHLILHGISSRREGFRRRATAPGAASSAIPANERYKMFDLKAFEKALEVLASDLVDTEATTSRPVHEVSFKPGRETLLEGIIERPVESALFIACRHLGEYAHKNGLSLLAMRDMLEEASSRRGEYCDGTLFWCVAPAWEGIGRTADNPGWCCNSLPTARSQHQAPGALQ